MIVVTKDNFSADEVVNSLREPEIGAIVVYVGTVRNSLEGIPSLGMKFEIDEESTRKSLIEVEKRSRENFDVQDVVIIHRVGTLSISENVLLVAVSAAHRDSAFKSCEFIVDSIKVLHSSWKEEVLA
jgi:molybdopterin synthase catalytic subunit